jgi:hypothetical protein
MKHFRPGSFPNRAQVSFHVFNSFVGALIRNTSFLMLLLFLGYAAVPAAVSTAKSFWHHPGVRSLVAAVEADLAHTSSSATALNTQPPPHSKDPAKVQRDENRERRKLASELRHSKGSTSSIKAVR